MKNWDRKKLAILLFVGVLIFCGFGLKSCGQEEEVKPEPVNLTFWSLWDEKDVFDPIIDGYKQLRPNVNITYKKMTPTEYEQAVVEALAAGKGPDIWIMHNTWLPRHQNKLTPMPEGFISIEDFSDSFVDVVSQDFVVDGQVYAIPLSVDTLALYYNKDLYNSAFITEPPAIWEEFNEDVKKLTKVDSQGNISQSGAAMGTANNIVRATDILSLLMLQNGTQMVNDDQDEATFNKSAVTATGEEYQPGLDALIFYTDFANPRKTVYTWNPTMFFSTDAFVAEKTAMMMGYWYLDETIRSKAPKLNYGIARMPQIKDTPKEVNYPNYWGYGVSAASQNPDYAWEFLNFMSRTENVKIYTEETGRPASRKNVLGEQAEDPKLRVFAEQALTAESWYQVDSEAIEGIFNQMIESVVLGQAGAEEALDKANNQVSGLMGR